MSALRHTTRKPAPRPRLRPVVSARVPADRWPAWTDRPLGRVLAAIVVASAPSAPVAKGGAR